MRDQGRTLVFSTHQMDAAEALCDSIAIVDLGRVVAGGTVSALKRASGRRTIRLGLDGEVAPAWLGVLDGVAAVRPGPGHVELELTPGVEPGAVLAAVVARGAAVNRFEVADPSLETLFIEHVGRAPDADGSLADGRMPASAAIEGVA